MKLDLLSPPTPVLHRRPLNCQPPGSGGVSVEVFSLTVNVNGKLAPAGGKICATVVVFEVVPSTVRLKFDSGDGLAVKGNAAPMTGPACFTIVMEAGGIKAPVARGAPSVPKRTPTRLPRPACGRD